MGLLSMQFVIDGVGFTVCKNSGLEGLQSQLYCCSVLGVMVFVAWANGWRVVLSFMFQSSLFQSSRFQNFICKVANFKIHMDAHVQLSSAMWIVLFQSSWCDGLLGQWLESCFKFHNSNPKADASFAFGVRGCRLMAKDSILQPRI